MTEEESEIKFIKQYKDLETKIDSLKRKLYLLTKICKHSKTENKQHYFPGCYDHNGYTEYSIVCSTCGIILKQWDNY